MNQTDDATTSVQERTRGMTLLFICLLSAWHGAIAVFRHIAARGARVGHDGNSSQRDFHPVGGFVGHNESVLGAAQRRV